MMVGASNIHAPSLKPRLSVLDFVLKAKAARQLWLSPMLQNPERKPGFEANYVVPV